MDVWVYLLIFLILLCHIHHIHNCPLEHKQALLTVLMEKVIRSFSHFAQIVRNVHYGRKGRFVLGQICPHQKNTIICDPWSRATKNSPQSHLIQSAVVQKNDRLILTIQCLSRSQQASIVGSQTSDLQTVLEQIGLNICKLKK